MIFSRVLEGKSSNCPLRRIGICVDRLEGHGPELRALQMEVPCPPV